jgi:hypothetical protein
MTVEQIDREVYEARHMSRMVRQQIEKLACRDPLIHAAVWRVYASAPGVHFEREEDKWTNVLQDLVAQMHSRHVITDAALTRYMERYGEGLLYAQEETVEMIPYD